MLVWKLTLKVTHITDHCDLAVQMSDPYTTITSQPKETLAACARILEMRGRESEQVRLREEILQGVRGRVLEVSTRDAYFIVTTM